MNEKEIGEIRRRTRRDRSNSSALYGCFVNDNKEIISKFRLSLATMPQDEAEQFFARMKKVLSGTLGKNLINIPFTTSQVADSPEHKLLMDLREQHLKNENTLAEFYQKVVESVVMDTSYLILMLCDDYDVPFRNHDALEGSGESDEVFRYLLCAVCPVTLSKPAIEYKAEDKEFHNSAVVQVLSQPVLGFMFPSFTDRSTDIYNAMLYTKDTADGHEDFVTAVFNTKPFVPANAQKKTFDNILATTLDEECSIDVVQTIYDELSNRIQLHKESRVPEPLMLDKSDITSVLESAGVSEDKVAQFTIEYDAIFGADTQLPPKNVIDPKRFEIRTPDAVIRVDPNRNDLIETRVIGGVKYIMIAVDEDVEVNGVRISLEPPATSE